MKFNNTFAIFLTSLIFLYLLLATLFNWEGTLVNMIAGACISILTLIAQFYYRTRPPAEPSATTTTATNQSTMTTTVAPGTETIDTTSGGEKPA